MQGTFNGGIASTFNQPVAWDTSKVTNMHTFYDAKAFNSRLACKDASKVTTMRWRSTAPRPSTRIAGHSEQGDTTMESTFFEAYAFDKPLWDTSRVRR